MKKRILTVLLACSMVVCAMTSAASAIIVTESLDATIDYSLMSSISSNMTYRQLAKLVLEKCSANFDTEDTQSVDQKNAGVVFVHPDFNAFDEISCGEAKSVVYLYDTEVDYTAEDVENFVQEDDRAYYGELVALLDQKVKDGTTVVYEYDVSFMNDVVRKSFGSDAITTTINGETVTPKLYEEPDADNGCWVLACLSGEKLAIANFEAWNNEQELLKEEAAAPLAKEADPVVGVTYDYGAEFYACYTIGKVAFPKGANTADNSNIALYSFTMLIALAGLTVVAYKKREN